MGATLFARSPHIGPQQALLDAMKAVPRDRRYGDESLAWHPFTVVRLRDEFVGAPLGRDRDPFVATGVFAIRMRDSNVLLAFGGGRSRPRGAPTKSTG